MLYSSQSQGRARAYAAKFLADTWPQPLEPTDALMRLVFDTCAKPPTFLLYPLIRQYIAEARSEETDAVATA